MLQSLLGLLANGVANFSVARSVTSAKYADEKTTRSAYAKNALRPRKNQSLGQIVDILIY